MSKLIGIATKSVKRGPMNSLNVAQVTRKQGVENDFRGKPGKRQVTLLSHKAWLEACDDLTVKLDWTARRANLLIDDIDLYLSAGKIIQIAEVRLLVTGETDPCARMNEVQPGLYDALLENWRGGVCCKVLTEGEISINDRVEIFE